MSGLGEVEWTPDAWEAFEEELLKRDYRVEHCSHCDRSNRHPSCRIVRIEEVSCTSKSGT